MGTVAKWSGDGIAAGGMTSSSVGTGDTAISVVSGAGVSVVQGGVRPPLIDFVPPANGAECVVEWVFPDQPSGGGRFYFTTPDTLPATGNIPYILEVHGAVGRLFSLDFTSTGRWNLRSNTVVLQQTAAGVIQVSTSYRVEWTLNGATNAVEVRIFAGDGAAVLHTLAGAATASATHNKVRLGRMNGGLVNPYQMDDLLVTNTAVMPGPFQSPNAPVLFRAVGSSWVPYVGQRLKL